MTNRIMKFKMVLSQCKLAYEKNPLLFPFEAIIHQLEYLIDLEEGKAQDLTQLKNIKIGWIAVRELDGYLEDELINKLCSISKDVEAILKERE